MTIKQVTRLIEWAKEKGYTLDDILELLKNIAAK